MKALEISTRKGLNLPIEGAADPVLEKTTSRSHQFAVLGEDYPGLKPTMLVKEGETVRKGQALLEDKKNPGALYTSPVSGTVKRILRGEKRKFLSIEIAAGAGEEKTFSPPSGALSSLGRQAAQDLLVESGEWTAIRKKPFSKVPPLAEKPGAILINCVDTNPLSAPIELILRGQEQAFVDGVDVISNLLEDGKTLFVSKPKNTNLSCFQDAGKNKKVKVVPVSGPHPVGLAGTQIHFLYPVSEKRSCWYIGLQDVIAIGRLFRSGKIDLSRIVAFAGPAFLKPKIMKVDRGADIEELAKPLLDPRGKETTSRSVRLISGSVFYGKKCVDGVHYLGRYDTQVTALNEGNEREFLGWQKPGFDRFSVKRAFAAAAFPWKKFAFNTNKMGSDRAMVPVGSYEKVMPHDIEPTFFLRSLLSQDLEKAIELGILEFDEEDLSLCTFVDPGKSDYGPLVRNLLTTIEKEG